MEDTTIRRVPTALFGATILLSAFLLFQVQPLIAKLILPWFGGSAAVWTSCMLFFQIALLGGYTYAHWLSDQSGPRQTAIHAGLLALSLLSLPILPSVWWKPDGPGDPLLRILGLLTATVGLPYFLLASTSPLLQSWYSRSNGGAMPYRLFALSNAGSMAGLLTYPILVEPNLTNRAQAWMWSIAYTTFAVVCVTVSFLSRRSRAAKPVWTTEDAGPAPAFSQKLLWMGLAATASALLLAVTNHVTQNIAPIPFLWVAPLGLYLLSFILCFDSDHWYHRTIFAVLAAVALPTMAYAIANADDFSSLKVAITFFCAAIFVLFMVCHGELASRRPAPAYLTSFYLMVSLGGAFGGLLIGFAAPYLFNAVYDLPVIVTLTAFLFVYLLWSERPALSRINQTLATAAPLVAAVAAAWIGSYLAKDTWQGMNNSRVLMRNFYGSLQVYDSDTAGKQSPVRILRHGTIDHGEQFLRAENRRRPTTYFTGGSGIGLAIHELQKHGPMHVGIIGLGAGSIAAYCRAGDNYRYYEINPQVLKVADEQFYYLRDCPAEHDVVLGDARLVIERSPVQKYDLLVVDAFSGDAIPVHLLTKEAWALYWKNLNPDGVLAVHVSNRYLRLAPVVALGAEGSGKEARIVSYDGTDIDEEAPSDWVLVTSRPGFFDQDGLRGKAEPIKPIPGLRPWTDDYSNVFKILR
jgi:hypothetical protein